MLRTIAAFDRIGEENAFAVLARANALAAQGRDIINLGIGQPDFRTPDFIVEAAVKALRDGHHGYTPANGIPPLREAVAADLAKRFKVEVSPDNVMIMPGGKPTMFMSILMFGEPGAEIMYPDPGFPIYRSMIEFTGAKPVPVPVREENSFAFSAEETLKLITPRTRLLILNSPANPTGGVTPKAEVDKLIAGLEKWPDVAIMSDEIYDHMVYDGEAHVCLLSYPSIRDRLILLNGWSKTYAMTGWRLGYAVWPGKLYDYARKLAVNLHSCVNASAQYAGLAALKGSQDEVRKMVAEFDKRRKVVVEGLNKLPGVSCAHAQGRVLRFPQRQAHGLEGKGPRIIASGRCRRCHHWRAGFRYPRRGLRAFILCQLDRKYLESAQPHGRVPVEQEGSVASRFSTSVRKDVVMLDRTSADRGLSEEQRMMRQSCRDFVDEVVLPFIKQNWKLEWSMVPEDRLPPRILEEAEKIGIRTLGVPEEFGGVELEKGTEVKTFALVAEEIARGDSGLADKMVQNWKVSVLLRQFAPKHLQEKWFKRLVAEPQFLMAHCLTEPRGASDRWLPYNVPEAAMQTKAVKTNGGWVINGRKQFISNGYDASLYVVYANTNQKVGMLQGTSSFLVPRETKGFTVARCNETLGCRFMNNGEMVFEDMFVPDDHLLVENSALGSAGVYFRPGKIIQAAKNLGVGVRAFEATADYVQNYVQGGRILIKHQAVALRVADMATRIEAVRALLGRASQAVDDNAPDAEVLVNMAKMFASEEIMKVAQHAVELHGGNGIMLDFGIEKVLRDAVIFMHMDATVDISKFKIVKNLFPETAGKYAGPED